MNSIFKKSAIAIAILGLTSSAYAGTVTGAFIGIDGLDLQPRTGDLDFLTVAPGSTVASFNTYAINPSYSWDFRLWAGLNFCGNNDLTVSWIRFHTSDHNDFGTPIDIVPSDILTSRPRWLNEGAWAEIYSSVNFNLDEVSAIFAHTLNLGPWALRLGGGAEWARLDSDHFTRANDSGDTTVGYTDHSHLHGVGPRIEFDMTYRMPYGIGAFAKTNLALLIASRETKLESFNVNDGLEPDFNFSTRHPIIPKAGIKLGLCWSYLWGMGGEGVSPNASTVTLEGGWMAETYIHAVERSAGFDNPTLGSGLTSNVETRTSDYGFQGLFLGVKLNTGWF